MQRAPQLYNLASLSSLNTHVRTTLSCATLVQALKSSLSAKMAFCEPVIGMAAAIATPLGVLYSLWKFHLIDSGLVKLAPCVC
jgi:hypothetical protein